MNQSTAAAVSHPAKFNTQILDAIRDSLAGQWALWDQDAMVVDPFAGIGGIHDLPYRTFGVELEPEWGEQMLERGNGWVGDFFDWVPVFKVGAVVTSCTYGNRMADHHAPAADDTSKRMTYRHSLGRELSENNSGAMQWGTAYRAFHIRAWIKVAHLLSGGGLFVLNVKDHIRAGEIVEVAGWHRRRVIATGFRLVEEVKVPVRGMGFGANGKVRIDHEWVYVFEKVRDESHWNVEGAARLAAKRDAAMVRHGE